MRALVAYAVAAALLAGGCAQPTVSEGVGSLGEVPGDSVLLVGRIEIVPRIKPEEQTFKVGWDAFNAGRHYIGRALLFTAEEPKYRDYTDHVLNPPLEETFFVRVPRKHRYMVKGSVTMSFQARAVSRRQVATEQVELLFPVPVELDIRPGDRAIYLGTLRLHRDEFHEVTKAQILDHYASAAAEFKGKFGAGTTLRKALLKPVRAK
jgi:hypothetical protein